MIEIQGMVYLDSWIPHRFLWQMLFWTITYINCTVATPILLLEVIGVLQLLCVVWILETSPMQAEGCQAVRVGS